MVNIIGNETMLHISFSLAAFIFSVVLFILVCALGTGEKHKNLTFRFFIVTIIAGNLLSILDNIFREAGIFPTPPWIKLLLLLLVYLANILLTFYMAMYMEGFFREFRYKKVLFRINSAIVISGIILISIVYSWRLIMFPGEEALNSFPIPIRIVFGYVYELYYLIYVVVLFVIFGKSLSTRARGTAIAAFTVVIGSVLFESLNTIGLGSGILYNYFGAVLGLYIFYIGVETPDYRNLLQTLMDLDSAKRVADEANRSKSDFLANMSHEIRTPINAVLGMNEMISREAEDETILAYSENIANAGKTLLGLINDILDFSKIEAGKIEILPVEYDLAVCLSDLVNMIRTRAENKELLLELDFDRKIPRFLKGDEVRVKQVITNILTNAVKYTEKGSVRFSVGFEKTDDPGSVILNVTVKDTGIGIKPEDLEKLFSEFERIEEKRNRNIEGTGLGMSITKRLLDLMGSKLSVESTYGEGSVFSFAIKQEVIKWEELGNYEDAYREHQNNLIRYHEKFTAPDARVLVVDDNNMNLMVFKSLIKKTKVKVDTADSGKDALVMAEKERYDVIFIDHMMPEMDGIETLEELRKSNGPNKGTPAICLTANAISGAKEYYINKGFEGYLSKPIDSAELENMLLLLIPGDKVKKITEGTEQKDERKPGTNGFEVLSGSPIDPVKGMHNGGDREAYLELLKAFYETMDERAEELGRFFDEENTEEYTIRVHALKSSAKIIGASGLGEYAQKLEDAGKAGDSAFIKDNHAAFMEDYMELKEPLSKVLYRREKEGPEGPEAGEEYLKSIYQRIRTAAEEYDTERLDTVFEMMEKYIIPERELERWNEVKSACERFDYALVPEILDRGK